MTDYAIWKPEHDGHAPPNWRKGMKWLCKMFGHTRRRGWWGDGLYGDVVSCGRDGIGSHHLCVRLECDRCGEKYTAARFYEGQVTRIAERSKRDA